MCEKANPDLVKCEDYNDCLDAYVLSSDKRYLRDPNFCRMLVKFGYRTTNPIYTPEQFEVQKSAALESIYPTKQDDLLFSQRMTTIDPVLTQLALREQLNINQVISTIIFLKARRKSGFEISGYIDYEQSLRIARRKTERFVDWHGVFQEKILLKPSPTNLSFFDWKSGSAKFNNSDNYEVLHDVNDGLMFMHRGDRKIVCVNLKTKRARNFTSSVWYSDVYGYVTLYDHVIRRKI